MITSICMTSTNFLLQKTFRPQEAVTALRLKYGGEKKAQVYKHNLISLLSNKRG